MQPSILAAVKNSERTNGLPVPPSMNGWIISVYALAVKTPSQINGSYSIEKEKVSTKLFVDVHLMQIDSGPYPFITFC